MKKLVLLSLLLIGCGGATMSDPPEPVEGSAAVVQPPPNVTRAPDLGPVTRHVCGLYEVTSDGGFVVGTKLTCSSAQPWEWLAVNGDWIACGVTDCEVGQPCRLAGAMGECR